MKKISTCSMKIAGFLPDVVYSALKYVINAKSAKAKQREVLLLFMKKLTLSAACRCNLDLSLNTQT